MITIPYTTALATYISYGLLFAFGQFRDLFRKIFDWFSTNDLQGYAPICLGLEDFYVRRLYLRIQAAYVGVMQKVSASDRWGYEARLRVYRESDLSQEKTRVLSSLTNCPDPDIVLEALDFSLSSEVRSQDAIFGLAAVSKEGCDTAWKWLKDNCDQIVKIYGNGFLISRFVSAVVSPFSSHEKAAEVE